MTCYEQIRKKTDTDKHKTFHRLESYFNALENNQLEEYHKKHGREVVLNEK